MTSKSDLIIIHFADEIASLRSIRPHAIITTNFDGFLKGIFDDYEPIVGQSVIVYNMNSFVNIYKIHGSNEDLASIVLR
ncbi:SIR2 family protein [Methylobacterium tarhaniae]|uniref:SIR2 family protein n=1 Tax=Methylobacterium tarhaniae TaxID=1187852 RepID=UPI000AFF63BE